MNQRKKDAYYYSNADDDDNNISRIIMLIYDERDLPIAFKSIVSIEGYIVEPFLVNTSDYSLLLLNAISGKQLYIMSYPSWYAYFNKFIFEFLIKESVEGGLVNVVATYNVPTLLDE